MHVFMHLIRLNQQSKQLYMHIFLTKFKKLHKIAKKCKKHLIFFGESGIIYTNQNFFGKGE